MNSLNVAYGDKNSKLSLSIDGCLHANRGNLINVCVLFADLKNKCDLFLNRTEAL